MKLDQYYLTLKLIFFKSVYEIFPSSEVLIYHSLNNGVFGKISKGTGEELKQEDILAIKDKMTEIVEANYKINSIKTPLCDINKKDCLVHRPDISKLLEYSPKDVQLELYELEGYYDFFYSPPFDSTGMINLFDLRYYEKHGGFILVSPKPESPYTLPTYKNDNKLADIFHENEKWAHIIGVSNVGSLNEIISSGDIKEMIRVNEALHEKKLAFTAHEICSSRDIKLVTVAGPSSSGKTTFTKRLAIHLKVNGLKPVVISLDNYYRGVDNMPLDEHGEKDFESIEGLDLPLLNENLCDLIDGKEVEIPNYSFKKGQREPFGTKVKLPRKGIILIEGIHGLNERLTRQINGKNKFKIYISCLTQLNLDNHNRIPTSEVRKLRRIVRDSISRNTSAEGTLSMWSSVRRGEEKNIFPFQEQADVMFNSNLFYEIGVLKKYAIAELEKIKEGNIYYEEARRSIKFLKFFKEIDKNLVPDDSILKEFVGGSYLYDY